MIKRTNTPILLKRNLCNAPWKTLSFLIGGSSLHLTKLPFVFAAFLNCNSAGGISNFVLTQSLSASLGTDPVDWTHLRAMISHGWLRPPEGQNVELVKVLWIPTAVPPHARQSEGTAALMRPPTERNHGVSGWQSSDNVRLGRLCIYSANLVIFRAHCLLTAEADAPPWVA